MTIRKHKVFVQGSISPIFISESITKHSSKKTIGAHAIFLGQVRMDVKENKTVVAIDYSSYEEMAEDAFNTIRENAFLKYDLICLHIYHSLGLVKKGEICFFVFVSSKHRKVAFDACSDIVDQIKSNVPIFGKEILEDKSFVWKENN